jgi:hypothetical protein
MAQHINPIAFRKWLSVLLSDATEKTGRRNPRPVGFMKNCFIPRAAG